MDLDALAAARSPEWERLDALSRSRRLDGAEVDELVTRYRSASADLADIKTSAGRTALGDHVSTILARARLRLTGSGSDARSALPRFFGSHLPAALYRLRWTTLAVACAFFVIGSLMALWLIADPQALAALGSKADLDYYAEHSFVDYYRENPAAVFAGTVWTNNAWIALQCVMFGITGVWPLYAIMQNAVGVGSSAAVMIATGHGDILWQFIVPHGMLELTSVFVAAAAGLHVFWAWVAPGRRSRGESLAAAGRTLVTVAVGLVFSLALSGAVEGFVTPQHWHWSIKIAIGAAALGVFLFYMLVIGRRATRAGETGDLAEVEAGTPRLVAG
ncbi:stage II sporulation protein M [Microbacterium horticulturae]|uniref:Stage II sporulation protein M n=1 Tax=Microbacterium horticulturae TaxID=3028316 RepID=A0ABY8BUM6_9MICO|nr:stage II sporulation protein M [Microbacterium sp. KACC 23027]WEG07879.1 stage II sporulation protein M [Microbacterium sp. KACC 23027]